jgi:hypothetical protein
VYQGSLLHLETVKKTYAIHFQWRCEIIPNTMNRNSSRKTDQSWFSGSVLRNPVTELRMSDSMTPDSGTDINIAASNRKVARAFVSKQEPPSTRVA